MSIIITGSGGLVGAEAVKYFVQYDKVIGIDNNYRARFFGPAASVEKNIEELKQLDNYVHYNMDFRDVEFINERPDLVIHCASQPSHDYASSHVMEDFDINAAGTVKLLEWTRQQNPDAVFIFMSTNKVYGDRINDLPGQAVGEDFGIDQTMHSVYGASKLAADIMVQEYGRYYGMMTVCFRGGCISGPGHSGVEAHGFLSYLMKCAIEDREYKIFGYGGMQVRDNIHSLDLIKAFHEFYKNPRSGEVYNMGGGIESNCTILKAIELCEEITGKKMRYSFVDTPRRGDHKWWISDLSKFKRHYPNWKINYNVRDILQQIYDKHNIPAR